MTESVQASFTARLNKIALPLRKAITYGRYRQVKMARHRKLTGATPSRVTSVPPQPLAQMLL